MNVVPLIEAGPVDPTGLVELAQRAAARGARAALLIIERTNGEVEILRYPDLFCVEVGFKEILREMLKETHLERGAE